MGRNGRKEERSGASLAWVVASVEERKNDARKLLISNFLPYFLNFPRDNKPVGGEWGRVEKREIDNGSNGRKEVSREYIIYIYVLYILLLSTCLDFPTKTTWEESGGKGRKVITHD